MYINKLLTIIIITFSLNCMADMAKSVKDHEDKIDSKQYSTQIKINVNTATVEELSVNLYGVGKATAEAIVSYREKNGYFKTMDDLDMVKNIGRSVLEKNKDIIVFK